MSFKLFDLYKRRSVAQLLHHGGVPARRFLARFKQIQAKRQAIEATTIIKEQVVNRQIAIS
ncbi:hypothetical protein EMIT0P74_140068 [Pseudomonas sp. IT-P74]